MLWFRDPAETVGKRENLRLPARGAELLADAADRDRAPGPAGQRRDRPGSTPVEDGVLVDRVGGDLVGPIGGDDAAMRRWELDLGMSTPLLLFSNQ